MDSQRHGLFLKQRHPQRALQDFTHLLGGVLNRIDALAPTQVRVHHVALNRPGANDGDFDDQVVIASRLEPGQHRHLCPAFNLKHADGVGVADHGVHGGVFERDGVKLKMLGC